MLQITPRHEHEVLNLAWLSLQSSKAVIQECEKKPHKTTCHATAEGQSSHCDVNQNKMETESIRRFVMKYSGMGYFSSTFLCLVANPK